MKSRQQPCHQRGVFQTPAPDDSTTAWACQVPSGHSLDSLTSSAPTCEPGCRQHLSTGSLAAVLSAGALTASSSQGRANGRPYSEGATGGLQPPGPPVTTALRVERGSATPHGFPVRDETVMPDDAGVSPTPAEPDVDLVAMARDIFGDMLADVPAEAEESRSWLCWVGPGHEHGLRGDGSTYCQTCHPTTVGRSCGPKAASTRRPEAVWAPTWTTR
jgi:hypothetical protein